MQIAISINANNPDTSFNVQELNDKLSEGWEVVQIGSSTMQAMVFVLEKKETE
jgi:hypothetical protein